MRSTEANVQHGLARYLGDGCRCEVCEDRHDLARRFLAARMGNSHETVRDIANEAQVTTQYGYLLSLRLRPDRPWEQARELHRAEREAHHLNRLFKSCPICGASHFRTRFCSERCYRVAYTHLRHTIAEGAELQRRREAMARWVVKNPDKVNEWQLRNAERRLDGTDNPRDFRWVVEGSLTWQWAIYVTQEGWPVADRLPPHVQEQVRDALASAEEPFPEPSE